MWDGAIAQSPYNAANFDMGHYVAAGSDAVKEVAKCLEYARKALGA